MNRIGPDRARVAALSGDHAVLRVGPGGTEVHVPLEALPEEVDEGTWVVIDAQMQPPMVIDVDEELTREMRNEPGESAP